jgi:hypothetical protein
MSLLCAAGAFLEGASASVQREKTGAADKKIRCAAGRAKAKRWHAICFSVVDGVGFY